MKSTGKITLIHPHNGIAAAETDDGLITVFEVMGSETVYPEDVIVGYLEEIGTQRIYNETKDEELDVYIHECGCFLGYVEDHYFGELQDRLRSAQLMVGWQEKENDTFGRRA